MWRIGIVRYIGGHRIRRLPRVIAAVIAIFSETISF